MKTEMGAVPYFEGYKYVGYGKVQYEQYILRSGQLEYWGTVVVNDDVGLLYEKAVPKRFVFEEVGRGERPPIRGEWYVTEVGEIKFAYVNVPTHHMIVRPVYADEK